MVKAINAAITQGVTQKEACAVFKIVPRKFRRWAKPVISQPRIAWNKILPEERQAILAIACTPEFWDKPLSHIFVHGHDSGKFFLSLSTVYNIIKSEKLVRPIKPRPRNKTYVSAQDLLDQGFSLLCYDATRFLTDSQVQVWAIPVMILPYRYLLHIGYSLQSVTGSDLANALKDALALLPEQLLNNLVAHSDRGSAMKASQTRTLIKTVLGAPVHFGRPHTPDDQAWIEAFIKTLKYHREAPASFTTVDDIVQWFGRFPDIYNNDPHSSLSYVSPLQALMGQQEVILNQRKLNLLAARNQRYSAWKNLQNKQSSFQASEVLRLFA